MKPCKLLHAVRIPATDISPHPLPWPPRPPVATLLWVRVATVATSNRQSSVTAVVRSGRGGEGIVFGCAWGEALACGGKNA
jgi:hypothetical protein